MIDFLALPEETRRLLIAQVSIKTGMSVKAIEKDWWVTLSLKAILSMPMQQHFIFKGGTSLSKAWKLIERFSEDIDTALAPEALMSLGEPFANVGIQSILATEGDSPAYTETPFTVTAVKPRKTFMRRCCYCMKNLKQVLYKNSLVNEKPATCQI